MSRSLIPCMSFVQPQVFSEASRTVRLLTAVLLVVSLVGCNGHPLAPGQKTVVQETSHTFQQSLDKEVDILFVVDNSPSMDDNQRNLAQQFPRLIETLRAPHLGGQLPNVRIGVVSTDLGGDAVAVLGPDCQPPGDGAQLQTQARDDKGNPANGVCPVPSDPWISYQEGQTNVIGGPADPVQQVKEAFSCIARLGINGCGIEQPLEAAQRALDPKRNLNPGFLRDDALLVVVVISDEDDCSVQNNQIYTAHMANVHGGQSMGFRCFYFGVQCDEPDPGAPGPKRNCQPAQNYLHDVERYASFFQSLKPAGRVLFAAIAGPTERVEVVNNGGVEWDLQDVCQESVGMKAVPALRIKAVADRFKEDGQFTSICDSDFGPALEQLGQRIVANLGDQCLKEPPLTEEDMLACNAGDPVALGPDGSWLTCGTTQLHAADCSVVETRAWGTVDQEALEIGRCSAALFADPANEDCGSECPCWRLAKRDQCSADTGSIYAVEILRREDAPKGTLAKVRCSTTPFAPGSPELAALVP